MSDSSFSIPKTAAVVLLAIALGGGGAYFFIGKAPAKSPTSVTGPARSAPSATPVVALFGAEATRTGLDAAFTQDSAELTKQAIAKGMPVDAKSPMELNLLGLAIATKKIAVFQELLDAGANPNLPTLGANTAVHMACTNKDARFLKAVLTAGGDPTLVNALGDTPLHVAVKNNNLGAAAMLLATGRVDRDARNAAGLTAAEEATRKGYNKLALYLTR